MATVVTDIGEQGIVDRIDGLGTQPDWIGSGTGAGTAAETDTTLFTEVSEARILGTASQPAADTFRVVGTQVYAGTKTITNAGTFDASTGGNLYVHGDFGGIAVNNSDSIQFTIDIVIS